MISTISTKTVIVSISVRRSVVSMISTISTKTVIVSIPSFRISICLGLTFGLTLLSFFNCGLFFCWFDDGDKGQTVGIRVMVSISQTMSVCQWSMSYGMGMCDR